MIFEGLPVTFIRRKGQKNVRLSIRQNTIRVSGPWWVSHAEMKAFLKAQASWVRTTLKKQQLQKTILLRETPSLFQPVLYLGTPYNINIAEPSSFIQLKKAGSAESEELFRIRTGTDTSSEAVSACIRKWLIRQAHQYFETALREEAQRMDVDFNRMYIRDQSTKWGSCSSKRNISLNWKLIQCPEQVIHYLMVHELCHLTEMNHSRAFWNLVACHCPEYEWSERWLKAFGTVVMDNY